MVQSMPRPAGFLTAPVNVMLLGVGAIAFMHSAPTSNPKQPLPLKVPVFLFVCFLGLGTFFALLGPAEWRLKSHFEIVQSAWYIVIPFVLYWLFFRAVNSAETARTVVLCCLLSSTLEASLSLYEAVAGAGRANAHLGEANHAGAYFAASSALFLGLSLLLKGKKRIACIAGWYLAVAALFLSLSRGGMLAGIAGTAIVLVCYIFFGRGQGFRKAFVVMLCFFVVMNALILIPSSVQDRFLFTFRGEGESMEVDDSTEQRLVILEVGWDLATARPFGYGAFTFPALMYTYGLTAEAKASHNIYLQVLVELGAQGLAALLLLIVIVHRRLFRSFRVHTGERRAFALGLLGWFATHCVAHLFVNSFFNLQVCGQFWVMLACFAVVESSANECERPSVSEPNVSDIHTGRIKSAKDFRPGVGKWEAMT
jgi:O-antigen ligase